MRQPYHSALGKYFPQAKASTFKPAYFPYGEVHYYDLTQGLMKMKFIEKADVLYSDLPWKHGYNKFYERSGLIPRMKYTEFLEFVSQLILALKLPAVMVSGRHAGNGLLFRDGSIPIKLNGDNAMAYLWHIDPEFFEGRHTSGRILYRLADNYNCVGDFCCGYGRSGKIFAGRGRRFVLSDINPDCIGYITENAVSWGPHEDLR